jgi:hypothetical protein
VSGWRFVPRSERRNHGMLPVYSGRCSCPTLLQHDDGRFVWGRCGSARYSVCVHCANMKALDVAASIRSGLNITDNEAMLTLTAPGVDVLPWDESSCSRSGRHRHSGDCCQVDADSAALWHSTMTLRLSHFWRDLDRQGLKPDYAKLLCAGMDLPTGWLLRLRFGSSRLSMGLVLN